MGGAGVGVPEDVVLGEDASFQERLDQAQDTLVPDPTSHPVHQGRVVDLVEARRDVTLQHPLIADAGEVADLGDGVLGPASGAEPVRARAKVRLEDRLQHQLQGRLHDPVTGGGDAKAAELAAGLGDHPLPHRQRFEPSGLEIVSQPGEQFRCAEDDRAGFHSIDSGRPRPPVAPNPLPRNHEEGGVVDEVVEVIEPTLGIVGRPLVQLGLHLQYP